MKPILVMICSMAALAAVRAEQLDNDQLQNGKPAKGAQGQVQVQTQPQPVTKVHTGGNAQVYGNRNLSRAPAYGDPRFNNSANVNRNLNARIIGQGNGQGFRQRNLNIATAPNPRIPSMQFRPNGHIAGSERWQGRNYDAFRSYHPQWHDHDWWRHHHDRLVLIGGGWYYWDSGFWYPAWGYDTSYSYYPYDGPIYAYNDLPPDQVVANVQSSLQEQGYYTGEIDGLLGPLTRAALAAYQRDHGLYMTAAIDQPTLASLGLG
jgi:hypothetical protein